MKGKHYKVALDLTALIGDPLHRTPIELKNASQAIASVGLNAPVNLHKFELGEVLEDDRGTYASTKNSKKIVGDNRNNTLRGTNRNDVIQGKGGNDTLLGLAGSDRLFGDEGNDKLLGGAGGDALDGGKGRDVLDGGADSDTLSDTAGDNVTDTLRGGAGNDNLRGGRGADILEGGAGNDNLFSYFSNGSSDGSIDTMKGGVGDDHYYVTNDSVLDSTIELPGEGTDTVFLVLSSITWTLADNIENLQLFAPSNGATGIGNSLNNIIQGKAGNNTLQGLAGDDLLSGGVNSNDILVGGEGADRFLFDGGKASMIPPSADNRLGVDTISDFVRGTDKIALARDTFIGLTTAIGQDLGTEFALVADDTLAAVSNALIVYSQASNTVFFNSNGSASGLGTVRYSGAFATVTGVSNLTSSDFQVVTTGLANLF